MEEKMIAIDSAILEAAEEAKNLKVENVKIKESDFKKFFLPLISGQIEANEENVNRFISNILTLTNSYYIGIDVYTDDMKEYLFSLQPIFSKAKINDLIKEINFDFISRKLSTLYKVNPREGSMFLDNVTSSLSKLIDADDEEIKEYLINAIKIFQRYNIKVGKVSEKLEEVKEEEREEKNKTEEEDLGDIFDY